MKLHEEGNQSAGIWITVLVQNRLVLDNDVATGRQIKQLAGVPIDYTLRRRAPGGNERIPDDDLVEVRKGDHFFARLQA